MLSYRVRGAQSALTKGKVIMNAIQRASEEFDAYYSTYDPCTDKLLTEFERIYAGRGDMSSYELKARGIAYLCDHASVHVFEHSPFFFEISSGRARHTWGGLQSHVGSFLHEKTADLWLNPYARETETDREEGRLHAWNNPVSFDHYSLGYDNILSVGFEGLAARAEAALERAEDAESRAFLRGSIASMRALMRLAARFADEARRLAAEADADETRAHYLRVAEAAGRVPAKSPRTFYEALASIVFCREAIGSLEGIGVSIFGHLDRLLEPYYTADITAGSMTHEDAKALLHMLLTYTDTRFEVRRGFFETSTTIEIGGCHLDGTPCYNGVTRALLEAVLEGRYVNTKINCRVSRAHPKAYFEQIAAVQAARIPVLVMQNDDAIIAARVKCGQSIEDARTYVGGGCHEITLQNTEVCTRADTWINLPRLLLDAMETSGAETFEAFYIDALETIKRFILRIMALKNKYERLWCKYDPLPLLSATMTGCLESARDATAGGTKYASTAISLLAPATLIDSLNTIKTLVYDRRETTLKALMALCRSDFEGHEAERRFIAQRIPKYGAGNDDVDAFGARVLKDVAALYRDERGMLYKNGRGGDYLPAFYAHDIFRPLGRKTIATPDGRRAFTPLSRGCSPSEFIESTPTDILRAVKAIDFTDYADSFCAEITLPQLPADRAQPLIAALIASFIAAGGSSLQFNLIDRDLLVEARKAPDEHRDVCVRVCGYSAVFVTLCDEIQDEIVSRAVR